MSSNIRIGTKEWGRMSSAAKNIIQRTAEGANPNVGFPFRELRLPRGYVEHPPNTDRTEVRNSLTVEFLGTPQGTYLVHLFNDGTIKTREQMYAENNQRIVDEQRLAAEESKFPQLGQTATRMQAQARLQGRIARLRDDKNMSVMAKQIEKNNAEMEYQGVLRAQAQARVSASAQAAAGARVGGGR